ncbi:MAG: hypothetical protein AAFY56_19010, partial [Pseudomonadota bacterium]
LDFDNIPIDIAPTESGDRLWVTNGVGVNGQGDGFLTRRVLEDGEGLEFNFADLGDVVRAELSVNFIRNVRDIDVGLSDDGVSVESDVSISGRDITITPTTAESFDTLTITAGSRDFFRIKELELEVIEDNLIA